MEVQTSGKPIDTLIERVLCMNILSSDYFKELYKLKTYHEVVDEIYEQVDHVEPWMTDVWTVETPRFAVHPSLCEALNTALDEEMSADPKVFLMGEEVGEYQGAYKISKGLLEKYGLERVFDTPITEIGFLYLRYAADPKTMWKWFEPYVKDEEEFAPGSDGRMTTMGVYVRDLLLGQYYFDSLFPRIPVPVMRQIKANLETMKLPTEHCGVTGESSRHGSDDTARRPPSVKASLSVSFGQRAPHRASTRDSSPVRRTLPTPRESSLDREGSDLDWDRDRDRGRQRDHDWDRDRVRDRERQRRYDFDRRSSDRDSRDRDYHRYSERDNGRREYEKSARDSDWHRNSRSHRSRSRSRSRSVSDRHPSPFRNDNADRVTAISSNLAKLKDLYGDANDKNVDAGNDRLRKDSSTEEVIRLGGSSWK